MKVNRLFHTFQRFFFQVIGKFSNQCVTGFLTGALLLEKFQQLAVITPGGGRAGRCPAPAGSQWGSVSKDMRRTMPRWRCLRAPRENRAAAGGSHEEGGIRDAGPAQAKGLRSPGLANHTRYLPGTHRSGDESGEHWAAELEEAAVLHRDTARQHGPNKGSPA